MRRAAANSCDYAAPIRQFAALKRGSAQLHSAVSQYCILRGRSKCRGLWNRRQPADAKSAIQQSATLRDGPALSHISRIAALAAAFLLFWSTATIAVGSGTGQGFEAANRLYEEGKFSDAAAAYERLLQGGASSPALYFNWGNAQFKAGRTGRAIAAYRKAEELIPRDPDVRANLQFARNQVQGPTLRAGLQERLLSMLSLNEWSLATAALFWLLFALLFARQVRPTAKRALRTWMFLTAGLLLLLGLGLALRLQARLGAQTAIVVVSDATVRNGPFDESPTAFTARDGAELRVLDQKDDWLQVTAGPRRLGWLPRAQVVVVPAL